jgi:riboflavin transporter
MIQTNVLSNRKQIISITGQFVFLTGIALIAPLIQNQVITGSIVNAVLFFSTVVLGVQAGILIGLIPSLIALFIGLLPIMFVPIIPFIILGNIILVLVFNFLKEKNYWLAVVSAGFLKFIFLFSVSSIFINLFLEKQTATKMALMMGWPQFFTALFGGLISYLFLTNFKKIK